MKTIITTLVMAGCFLAASTWLKGQDPPPVGPATDVTANKPPAVADPNASGTENENLEVLMRGPVHEAFAQQYVADPEETPVISQEPPEPIDEVPPDVMPDGDNVQWIPGYWAWDDERGDFIWISGLWRDVPPSQRWVPGSWSQVQGGWQWVPGFWTSDSVTEVTYLPEAPPPTQENGPNVASPGDDYFWVPGNWVYDNSYQWQPGYWAQVRPDWVWVPSRYYWSPGGYVYCAGYWDYPPIARGTLFSPVFVPGYRFGRYVPSYVVPVGPLLVNLFVRPGFYNYYYGNYYGNNYLTAGFTPWVNAYSLGGFGGPRGGYYYDPLWSYYRFGRPNTFNRLLGWNQYYQFNSDARPPVRFADFRGWQSRAGVDAAVARQATLAASLDDVRNDRDGFGRFVKFHDVDRQRREQIDQSVRQFRDFQQQRGRFDAQARGSARGQAGLALPPLDRERSRDADRQNAQPDLELNRDRERSRTEGSSGRLPEPPRSGRGQRNAEDVLGNDAPALQGDAQRRMEEQRRQIEERTRNLREGRGQPGERTPPTRSPRDSNRPEGRDDSPRTTPENRPGPRGTPPERDGQTPSRGVNPPPQRDRGTPERTPSQRPGDSTERETRRPVTPPERTPSTNPGNRPQSPQTPPSATPPRDRPIPLPRPQEPSGRNPQEPPARNPQVPSGERPAPRGTPPQTEGPAPGLTPPRAAPERPSPGRAPGGEDSPGRRDRGR